MRRKLPVSILIAITYATLIAGLAVGCHDNTNDPVPPPVDCDLRLADEACWDEATGVGDAELEVVNGDIEVTVANGYADQGVISNKLVHGCINFPDPNISGFHLRYVKVDGDHQCTIPNVSAGMINTGNSGFRTGFIDIRYSEVDGTNLPDIDSLGVGQSNYFCSRCKIYGTTKGAKGATPAIFTESYVPHNRQTAIHGEAFLYSGGCGNVHVVHNFVRDDNLILSGNSGGVMFFNDFGCSGTQAGSEIRDNYIANNIANGEAGGAGIGAGAFCDKTPPFLDHLTITGNVVAFKIGKPFAYGFNPSGTNNVWGGSGALVNVSLNAAEDTATTINAPNPDGGPCPSHP